MTRQYHEAFRNAQRFSLRVRCGSSAASSQPCAWPPPSAAT